MEILQSPRILAGLDPRYAWKFFATNHLHGFVVLGSVVLCITGGEALYVWGWPMWKALPPVGLFLLFDLSFFGANLFKIIDGGWITLVVAIAITTIFTTWKKGRETLLTTGTSLMMRWRKAVFAFMSKNATNPTTFFGIPPNRVVELGSQVKL